MTASLKLVAKTAASHGDFFAIDHRCWPVVCGHGLTAAVAYLVIARGSGGDQRTSSWSVNAIEQRTAISRFQAKAAIAKLVAAGLVKLTKAGTKPRYHISPAHEVTGSSAYPPPAVALFEQELLNKWDTGWNHVTGKSDNFFAGNLVTKGLAEKSGSQFKPIIYDREAAEKPVWLWLPNSLIDLFDTQTGEILTRSPVERVRQTQDAAALQLLVECYAAHRLEDAGGVHWRAYQETYVRHKIAERAEWVVWSFVYETKTTWRDRYPTKALMREAANGKSPDERLRTFWAALEKLQKLCLVEIVPHLIEADTDEGSVIHPCPIDTGERDEQALAAAAEGAALALCGETGIAMAERLGGILVPVLAHMSEVAVVGILRLKYRPHTGATTAWLANSIDWGEQEKRYLAMAKPTNGRRAVA